MEWSALFQAPIVVLGCGNTLFGDDGLAPKAVSMLAKEAHSTGHFPHVAFVDAGTSVRSLLMDLTLSPANMRRLIVVDVVQEKGRATGDIAVEYMQAAAHGQRGVGQAQSASSVTFTAGPQKHALPAWGDSSLHQAPTRALLHRLHATLGIELIVVTVQAGYIPPLMDDSLSPSACEALPHVLDTLRALCRESSGPSKYTGHTGPSGSVGATPTMPISLTSPLPPLPAHDEQPRSPLPCAVLCRLSQREEKV